MGDNDNFRFIYSVLSTANLLNRLQRSYPGQNTLPKFGKFYEILENWTIFNENLQRKIPLFISDYCKSLLIWKKNKKWSLPIIYFKNWMSYKKSYEL